MELIYEANRIYINDEEGKMIAEITFPIIENGWRANTSCSYAAYWKEEHPESLDLFSQD